MKKVFVTIKINLIVLSIVVAQSATEVKLKQEIWQNAPQEFGTTEVPEKWKNESAVLLAFQSEYIGDFTSKVTGLTSITRFYIEKINIHYRFKLQDKAATKDFSELTFNNKTIKTNLFGKANAYRIIGIKVIKPDGTEKEVDLSTAVKTDTGSDKELKIAVPNLEPGDILDYFISLRDESSAMPDFGDEFLLERKYPIVNQLISFKVPHQIHFYSYPINGAPDFTKEVINRDVLYSLKDKMRDKAPNILWNYEYRSAPHIRYLITKNEAKPNAVEKAADLLRTADQYRVDNGALVDFLKGNFKKEKNKVKIVNELYYALRNPIYRKAYYKAETGDPLDNDYSPNLFYFLMKQTLDKYKIGYTFMMAPSRVMGPMDSHVNLSACDFVLQTKTNPPLYIFRPSAFTLPDEIPSVFEGMEARTQFESKELLKETDAKQNITKTKIAVAIEGNDVMKFNIKRSVSAEGHNKRYHQYLIVTNYDYLKAYDMPKYQVQSSNLLRGVIKEYNKEKIKLEQRLAQDYNERDNKIKAEIEEQMEVKVSEYKGLKIKNIGMWHTEPVTEYADEFVLEGISKKAGPSVIIELGKLIEQQTDIKEEDKVRTRDVYMNHARTFVNEIEFTIPDGYAPEGLESFNKTIENELGGFVSTAKVENNKIVLSTKKYYLKNYYTPNEWPQLVSFLNLAAEFYNAKLLLKKSGAQGS
jgi:hypothetical protein